MLFRRVIDMNQCSDNIQHELPALQKMEDGMEVWEPVCEIDTNIYEAMNPDEIDIYT